MKEALIIFAKNPVYGQVKTRLAATAGMSKALKVYHKLVEHTVSITMGLDVRRFVFYSDFIASNDAWSDKIFSKELQYEGDLGQRMSKAFETVFAKGYHNVVIIGTDCPQLDEHVLTNSFKQLENNDVVIGPATDGGYYLLGLKRLELSLFKNITWSTNQVLKQTLHACAIGRLSVSMLSELSDIDTEEDLKSFAQSNPWIDD